jgi:hypothetical protein
MLQLSKLQKELDTLCLEARTRETALLTLSDEISAKRQELAAAQEKWRKTPQGDPHEALQRLQ